MRHEHSFPTWLGLAIATLWTPFACGGDDDTAQDTDASTGALTSTSTATSGFTSFTSSGPSTTTPTTAEGNDEASDVTTSTTTTESGEGPAWTCDELPQAGAVALIDDFELDYLPQEDGRVGGWFAYDDGTGGERSPEPYAHTQEDAYSGESSARIHGQGFTYWGAALGVVLNHNGQGSCPYDASTYDGISFWARGLGTVLLHFSTVPTTPIEEGGTCTAGCWANYGIPIELTDTWELYTITWDQLMPATWGPSSVFDPAELIYMHWQFNEDHGYTPFDLWLDDVSFYALDDGGTTGTGETDSDSATGGSTEGTGTAGDDSTGSTGTAGDGSTGSTGTVETTGEASSSEGAPSESGSSSETGGSDSGSSSGMG